VALLLVLHGIELIGLVIAAGVTTRLARSHPGHGAGLPTLIVLAAMALVGWQGYRLLRGRWSLNVSGLAVQSLILITAIAVATQHVAAGGIGILVACAVLVGCTNRVKYHTTLPGRRGIGHDVHQAPSGWTGPSHLLTESPPYRQPALAGGAESISPPDITTAASPPTMYCFMSLSFTSPLA
jgi:hypothetical protein